MSGTEALSSVIYVSAATIAFTRSDLVELLERSRQRNARDGISGLLLHRGGNFIQALEGPPEAVEATYRRIAADPRHGGLITLLRRTIPAREFGDWAMGFENISAEAGDALPGFSNFLQEFDRRAPSVDDSPIILRLLKSFCEGNR
ncbi:MAG TPA: BLUF domain-containing protein [Alphaproteobacteria bacterium]|nr:BLUF domain-containing protein [Alphaproteobacteria bacterium]